MKRHVSTLLSTLPFVAIAALGVWIFHFNTEIPEVEARVEQPREETPFVEEGPPPTSPLEMEQRRLAELQARLADTRPPADAPQPPTGSIDTHLANTQQRIGELESQIATLKGDATAVQQNAATFRQEQTASDDVVKIALEKQLQGLDTEILEAQTQAAQKPELKAQVDTLKAQRDDLNDRIRQLGTQTQSTLAEASGQAQAEQREVLDERADLQRQMADLKSDLEYWQGQKNGAGQGATASRAQALENEIKMQESRVKALEDLNPKTEVQ